MATTRVTKVVLDKRQTAFVEKEGSNGMGVVSGTVEQIGALMAQVGCDGCQIVFSTHYAPNFKRAFNAAVKRANQIAAAAGVSLSAPSEYSIQGFIQADKWVMEVVG